MMMMMKSVDILTIRIRDWRPHRLQEAQSLLVQPLLQYWLPRFLRSKDQGSPLISYEGSDVSVESIGRPTSATSLGFDTADVTSRPQSCIPRLRSSTEAARRIYGSGQGKADEFERFKTSVSRSRSARSTHNHSSTPQVDQLQSESNVTRTRPSSKNKKGKDEAKQKQEELRMKKELERRFPITKVRPRKSSSSTRRPKSSPSTGADSKIVSFCISATRPPTAPNNTGRGTPTKKCEHEKKVETKSPGKQPNRPKTAEAQREELSSDVTQETEVTQVEQTLVLDKRAGNFFEQFCEASGNKIWVNAVDFWRDLQEYRRLFNTEPRQDYNIQRKARRLYSRYIVTGASRSILCPVDISFEVGCALSAEAHSQDTFSSVEDHALLVLKEAWLAMRSEEADLLVGPLKIPH
ncbi:uncharacterized protein LOC144877206 [Branchiostoma floridae x Branchiostoma japonicum]